MRAELRLCERCSHTFDEHKGRRSYIDLSGNQRDESYCYCCDCWAFVDEPDFRPPTHLEASRP